MGSINSRNEAEPIDLSFQIIQNSNQSSDSDDPNLEFNITKLNPGDFEVILNQQMSEIILNDLELTIDNVLQPLNHQYFLKKDVIYPNGIFTGQFKRGKRHGIGIFKMGTGEKYHGNWVDDCPTGKGRLTMINQDYYEGDFFQGMFFGTGVYKSMDYSYEGEWINDKQDGFGTEKYLFPQSQEELEEYKGNFRKGLRHGEGTLTIIKGDLKNEFDGIFYNGVMQTARLEMRGIEIQGVVVNDQLKPILIELHEKKLSIEFENTSNFQGKVYFEDNSSIYFKLDQSSIESISLSNDPPNSNLLNSQ